jgi:hypothetical protein
MSEQESIERLAWLDNKLSQGDPEPGEHPAPRKHTASMLQQIGQLLQSKN